MELSGYFIGRRKQESPEKGFTLVELLIVLAIIAVLAVVAVLTLNPGELLRQTRDAARISDLSTLQTAIALYQSDFPDSSLGVSGVCYVANSSADIGASTSTWTEATDAFPWTKRQVGATLVFNNKLWVMGGFDVTSGTVLNDVWYSADGANWTEATSSAAWPARQQFGATVFNGKMWVIGGASDTDGLSDAWSSSDGVNWTEVTDSVPWTTRLVGGALTFNNKLWVMGGFDGASGNVLNDVWYSADGANWTEATPSAGWAARKEFGATVFGGKMWVLGGVSNTVGFSDAWNSSDGANWTEVTGAVSWATRQVGGALTFNNKLWVMGGLGFASGNVLNDVWYSADGANWTEDTSSAEWPARKEFGAAVSGGKMWVLGGVSNAVGFSDAWSSASPGCLSYFQTAISVATSTAVAIDGSGWIPVDFTAITSGNPIPRLPVDPLGSDNPDFFYSYIADTISSKFKLAGEMESALYGPGGSKDVVSKDGGISATVYEVGSGLDL